MPGAGGENGSGAAARGDAGARRPPLNPNVAKAYLFTLFGGAARGIWSFSVLSGYLYVLSNNSNWSVGLAEGIQGGAQAAVAIFGGVLADSWRRDRVLVLAGATGIIAVVVTILAVNVYLFGVSDHGTQFYFMCVALSLWGSYQGLWNTGLETIFADSIPKNQRSKPTTNKYILQLISTVTGPVFAIFLFLGFGDEWRIVELRTVLMVGAALCAPPAFLLFLFRDEDMVSHRSRRQARRAVGAGGGGAGAYEPLRNPAEGGGSCGEERSRGQDQVLERGSRRKTSELTAARLEGEVPEGETGGREYRILVGEGEEEGKGDDRLLARMLQEAEDEADEDDIPSPMLPTPSLFPSPPQSPRGGRGPSRSHSLSRHARQSQRSRSHSHHAHQQQQRRPRGSTPPRRNGEGGGAGPASAEDENRTLVPPPVSPAQQGLLSDDVLDSSDRARRVPYVTILSDVLSGFGSGMTIKFFPLFFKNKLGLSPIKVNSIYVCLPVAMAIGSQAAQVLRRKIGRAQTCILYGYIGALALAAMSQLTQYKDFEVWQILVPIYFLSSAQHCTRPLKKSILMDYVPKKTRARWNSIDSITRFGWSGSAVVGGYLVDRYSYSVTFLVTAIMQFVAATSFFLLVPIVKIEPPRPKYDAHGAPQEQGKDEGCGQIHPKLLRANVVEDCKHSGDLHEKDDIKKKLCINRSDSIPQN
mmetsp:Transcript_11714/g.28866  ORF Transcript_11714/g.28866 Transcript_11714/m.28866 type:complete len:698 (+) Transcript_11714:20-2113(+)